MKIVKIVLVLLLLSSCKAKKVEHTIIQKDTIYKSEIIKIDKPQLNTIFIESVCDSSGVLLPIFYTNISDNVRTTLKSDNNTLKLEVNVDSIVSSKVKEYKSKHKTETITLVKYKNKKTMWYSLILNFVLLVWIFKKPLLMLIKPF